MKYYEVRVITYLEVQMEAGLTKLVLYALIRGLRATNWDWMSISLLGFVEVTTCAVPAAPGELNSIQEKLILTQVTLASDDDDGIHAHNNPK